jgi:predicted TIM-barrel fold metal-dependent hydrolase
VRQPIAGPSGRLLPAWERLILDHPDRFMVGSDPVWPVERLDGWDQADTGWERLGEFLQFHRDWAAGLPPEVAEMLLRGNARRVYLGGDGPQVAR